MGVEEVPERPVAHVVQEPGQAHQRFDVAAAGHVGADLAKAVVERSNRPAGQVHRAEDVLKPRMLGGGKDPPGGLQLVDLPQALQPRIIEYLPLAHFAFRQSHGRSERDISVDRIVAEAFALEVFHAGILPPLGADFQVPSPTVFVMVVDNRRIFKPNANPGSIVPCQEQRPRTPPFD